MKFIYVLMQYTKYFSVYFVTQSAFKMKNIVPVLKIKYSLREKLIILLFNYSKELYRIFIKRNVKPWSFSLQDLNKFRKGSLGKELATFLQKHHFDLEPKFEKHDIYHILTDYPTNVIGEISLSVFNVGNGKRSIYTIGVALIGVFIMLEEYQVFIKAYKRGKAARSFAKWKFEFLLNENTQELKKHIFREDNNLELMI